MKFPSKGFGKIVSIGTEAEKKLELKKGDTVWYNGYEPDRIRDGEKEYLILRMNEIVAVKHEP